MKQLITLAFAIFYLPMAIANSPAGTWSTIDDKTGEKRAEVNLEITDGVLSGKIIRVYAQAGDRGICLKCPGKFKNKPIEGLKFVWGLKEMSHGVWSGGQILDAKSGKIYDVKMTVKGNKLYVRGYVGVSMMGRTQVWVN